MFLAINSCATFEAKKFPAYRGVDKRAQKLVDEYKWLAKQEHITFKKQVTVGFTSIKLQDAIGVCTWSIFREIDIDDYYWSYASQTSKMSLLFHELTHCYCHRDHDYGKGTHYKDDRLGRLTEAVKAFATGEVQPGFMEDGCPKSIMYPVVLEDECMQKHYAEYTKEMFNRCEPW